MRMGTQLLMAVLRTRKLPVNRFPFLHVCYINDKQEGKQFKNCNDSFN